MTSKIPVCTSQGGPLWVGLVGRGLPFKEDHTKPTKQNPPGTYKHAGNQVTPDTTSRDDLSKEERMRSNALCACFRTPGCCPSLASTDTAPSGHFAIEAKIIGVVAQRLTVTRYSPEIQWLQESLTVSDEKVFEHLLVDITSVLPGSYLRRQRQVPIKTRWTSGKGAQTLSREPVKSTFNHSHPRLWRGISTPERDHKARMSADERGLGRTRRLRDVGFYQSKQSVAILGTGYTSQRSLWPRARQEVDGSNFGTPPHPIIMNAANPRGVVLGNFTITLAFIKPLGGSAQWKNVQGEGDVEKEVGSWFESKNEASWISSVCKAAPHSKSWGSDSSHES